MFPLLSRSLKQIPQRLLPFCPIRRTLATKLSHQQKGPRVQDWILDIPAYISFRVQGIPRYPAPNPKNWRIAEEWLRPLQPHFDRYTSGSVEDAADHISAQGGFTQTSSSEVVQDDYFDAQVGQVLLRGRNARQNPLVYLALKKKDWGMIAWIVRVITEQPHFRHDDHLAMTMEPISIKHMSNLPQPATASFNDLLAQPLFLEMDQPPQSVTEVANRSSALSSRIQIQRAAINTVLEFLGQMIMVSYTCKNVAKSQMFMDQVLNIFAILHHNSVIPDLTYRSMKNSSESRLAPPQYLADLYQPMLTAILDAEWNIYQEHPELATFSSVAQVEIPGYEFPAHNNPKRILPYCHGIWLELLLWICLRGHWMHAGGSIIRMINSTKSPIDWKSSSWRKWLPSSSDDRCVIPPGTISTEVLNSYVEAMIDASATSSSISGIKEDTLIRYMQHAKELLHKDQTAANSLEWERTMSRYLISKDLGTSNVKILKASKLISDLIAKKHPTETSTKDDGLIEGEIRDDTELRGIPLRLLTLALEQGDIVLIRELVEAMELQRIVTGSHEFLKNLLLCVCDSDQYEAAHDLLFKLPSGPLIIKDHYQEPELAASLVRYAVSTSNRALLIDILKPAVLTNLPQSKSTLALLICQIETRRWSAVLSTIKALEDGPSGDWQLRAFVILVKEVLTLQGKRSKSVDAGTDTAGLAQALDALSLLSIKMLQASPRQSEQQRASTYTVLGVLASIDPEWALFCASALRGAKRTLAQNKHTHVITSLSPDFMAVLLQGVANFGGLEAVAHIWQTWCIPQTSQGIKHRAALVAHFRTDSEYYPENWLLVDFPSWAKIRYVGKMQPSLSMVRVLLTQDLLQPYREQGENSSVFKSLAALLGWDEKMVRKHLMQGAEPYKPWALVEDYRRDREEEREDAEDGAE
ncbi:hypothetical protein BT63DRAFT_421513 [Microthyrium microscopicum]|uniref:Uncharacterized protein n=1 Tax=Microthyrium microscopicum TaxID=703497 RepID=A0A6A6UM51_9PEZI|nr:hypothetical protein BT63DRAFT_421513 [Microthyrium microscopicum]